MSQKSNESVVRDEFRLVSMLRAARGALGWNQQELADRSGVSLIALARLESGAASPRLSTVSRLKAALTQAGIHLIEGEPAGGFTLQVSAGALAGASRVLGDREGTGGPDKKQRKTDS